MFPCGRLRTGIVAVPAMLVRSLARGDMGGIEWDWHRCLDLCGSRELAPAGPRGGEGRKDVGTAETCHLPAPLGASPPARRGTHCYYDSHAGAVPSTKRYGWDRVRLAWVVRNVLFPSQGNWPRRGRGVARGGRTTGVLLEDLCFEFQQAAEKAPKAVLINADAQVPRTHALGLLM